MPYDSDLNDMEDTIPQAKVVPSKPHFSLIWLIPSIALLIGAFLVYKAISEKGPIVTITFQNAEGLKPGETKVKYKDVTLGKVEEIRLGPDLSHVEITVQFDKQAKAFLTANTKFWVVRARVGVDQVSGLGTLFSGAYISMDPGNKDPNQSFSVTKHFTGLEKPPLITTDRPGRYFNLRANRKGSVDIGSPVYYRQMKVGQVVNYQLNDAGQAVNIKIFINDPFHHFIYENTRFWNASGLDLTVDTEGIRLTTESLVTMLIGGIAFETPTNLASGNPATEYTQFELFESQEQIYEMAYAYKENWLLYFDGSVRGLKIGAPVEFRGLRIGRVVDVSLELDIDQQMVRIPVLIEVEPDRIKTSLKTPPKFGKKEIFIKLVRQGLRAQLLTGSFITGQLLVNLDFYPHSTPVPIKHQGRFPILPTVPTPIDEITQSIASFLTKLEKLPMEKIGQELRESIKSVKNLMNSQELHQAISRLNATAANTKAITSKLNDTLPGDLKEVSATLKNTLNKARGFADALNTQVLPKLNGTLDQARSTIKSIQGTVNPDALLIQQASVLINELTDAARAVKTMADYLERHPDALIYGKGEHK